MVRSSGRTAKCISPRAVTSDHGCVVLDVLHDRILKLNAVGTEMWHLLSIGQTEAEIARTVAQRHEVPEQRVAEDLKRLLAQIEELNVSPGDCTFVEQTVAPTQSASSSYPWYGQIAGEDQTPKPRALLVLAASLGLAVFDLILYTTGLKTLCMLVKAWPLRRQRSSESLTTGQICSSVQLACVWYPKRALCLQRSAVTTCLLKIYGVTASMVVGIRPMPFMAHAWVESEGNVVNDWPGVRKFYSSVVAY